MIKKILKILIIIHAINIQAQTVNDEIIIIETSEGDITLHLDGKRAPITVNNFIELIRADYFDNSIFHRVIDNFMAQTGDVEFGNSSNDKFNMSRAGTGGSSLPDIPAEFSDANHGRGAVSMARAQNPNSANSQFFIVFNDASFLDGQYTVWAQVTEGMELVDNITRGEPPQDPDKIIKMEIISE